MKHLRNATILLILTLIFTTSEAQFSISEKKILKKENSIHCFFIFSLPSTIKNDSYGYTITPQVLDINSNAVYLGKDLYFRISQKSVQKTKEIEFFIPYNCINLPAGSTKIKIQFLLKKNNTEISTTQTNTIIIKMPILYRYQEQEISIKNLKITQKKEHLVEGLKATFYVYFKYPSSKIRGSAENASLNDYLVSIDFKNVINNSEIQLFEKTVSEKVIKGKTAKQKVSIFIPKHNIVLPKGKYNVQIKVSFTNLNKTFKFNVSQAKNVTLFQPQIYFANVELKSLWVVEKKYDASSSLGRLFSRKGSNVGKGWPDVFWTISVGTIQKYRSSKNKNSFSAIAGRAEFTIAEKDPIFLAVYDFDMFNKNDFIGNIKFSHKKGNDKRTYEQKKFDDVASASLVFTKEAIPFIKNNSISISDTKRAGVSGKLLNYAYNLNIIPENHSINFSVVSKTKNNLHLVPYFENISNQNLTITKGESSGKLQLFIPDFMINTDAFYGINTKLDKKYILGLTSLEKKILVSDINDIKVSVSTKPGERNKVQGFFISLTPKIPEIYSKNIPVNGMKFQLKLTESEKIKAEFLEFISPENNNFTDLKLEKNRSTPVFFVPYYKLKSPESFWEFNCSIKTQINDNKLVIGNNEIYISEKIPEIKIVPIKKIVIKLKRRYRKTKANYFVKIIRGNQEIYKSGKQTVAKRIIFDADNLQFPSVKEDIIQFFVFKEEDGNIDQVSSFEFSVAQLLASKKKISRKGKQLSKIIVK